MNEPTTPGMPPSVEGIVTRPSPFSVEETLERLKATIHNRNLILFAHIDHSGEARRVGLTMQEAQVLIFGSPKARANASGGGKEVGAKCKLQQALPMCKHEHS